MFTKRSTTTTDEVANGAAFREYWAAVKHGTDDDSFLWGV